MNVWSPGRGLPPAFPRQSSCAGLTPKHTLVLRPQWDFRREEFRSLVFRIVRSFPEFELILQVKHDEIRDETTFGASLGRLEF